MGERPFSVVDLASRWGVSEHHIRNMLADGRLKGFRVGGRLWRISAGEVDRFECQTIDSDGSKEDSSRFGTMPESAIAGRLSQILRQKHGRPSESSPVNVTDLSDHRSKSQ